MSVLLPESANLEHLKGQAKTLLSALQEGDVNALSRMEGLPPQSSYRLAHAQLAIAREYGFESWAKLKRHLVGYPERRTELFAAIRGGDRPTVQRLLTDDPYLVHAYDPNAFGATVLNAATDRNDIGMIDLLIDFGADPNAASDWGPGGFRPLEFGAEATAHHLMSRGATLTAHAAARLGMVAELKRIIAENPAVIHERGGDGQFPLHYSKTPEIVDILLEAGAEIDVRDIDHEGTALQWKIVNEPVARRLAERGARLDVFSAIALGDVDMLGKLIDEDPGALTRGSNEPGNPWIPIPPGRHIYAYQIGFVHPHQAASNLGQEECYRLLWDKSDPVQRLMMACWRADEAAAKQLVAEHPDLITDLKLQEKRVLPHAAWNRRKESVKLMLELGFDVNVQDEEGMTPLASAGFHGFDDVIEIILPFKPDFTIKNVYGGRPLGATMYGSVHGWSRTGDYARSVELMLSAGAPLPDAIGGSEAVREVLIRHGMSG